MLYYQFKYRIFIWNQNTNKMKTQLFTLEPGDRFRFINERAAYKVKDKDFDDFHGAEVVFIDLATGKAYLAKGYAVQNEVITIN